MSGPRAKNISGQTFGKLTVIQRDGITNDRHARWLCLCECGKTILITFTNLKRRRLPQCSTCRIEGARNRIVKGLGHQNSRSYKNMQFCQRGHELTPSNLKMVPRKNRPSGIGYRCRTCVIYAELAHDARVRLGEKKQQLEVLKQEAILLGVSEDILERILE